ncbi:uncharacterized protein Z520_10637 [Fonsecaea multimorphosa CBS 102226]|uniref:COP9 signalosome complex subunit 6 n=1 Tax=Fonsecaea multimorphosa CBS 102226 TaxID=1442371 RepID=A0A0D2I973_9EURO|nr:uncharacterized protein Z520_10637 [Fonsecaea multimorphosa CBS 102226]KIX93731.1 hypothetical protein Z520_10637 [Fonsecaea multimorphosa CBS 102226]OAL19839.1 hypothetical protein AYO22_09366 [Fonsecaea multimorphosa]
MADPSKNPLLSSRPSESDLTVSLHPLVLLTISDQVTRHSVRKQPGPVAGALLGQQRGREITVEHAFPAALVRSPEGQWRFNFEWMETRIQQYIAVHKSPALGFVGWFTLCPPEGPLPELVPLQEQAINFYNDNAILLALHPEAIQSGENVGGKLPITIYESVDDREQHKDEASMQTDGVEGSMQIDAEETSVTKFRQLPYTIETDETEMIAIDYVAKGAGGAAAIDHAPPQEPASTSFEVPQTENKGKKRADLRSETPDRQEISGAEGQVKALTPEEEDQIAGITTRLNGVKMLQSRLELLRTFIQSLPPSYISAPDSDTGTVPLTPTAPESSHLPHLRNIQALLTRLSLLTPPTESTQDHPLASASLAQANDVSLVSLLALLGQDIQALSELGRKAVTVEANKNNSKGKHQQQGGPKGGGGGGGVGGMGPGGPTGFASMDDGDPRFAGIGGVNSAGASAMV